LQNAIRLDIVGPHEDLHKELQVFLSFLFHGRPKPYETEKESRMKFLCMKNCKWWAQGQKFDIGQAHSTPNEEVPARRQNRWGQVKNLTFLGHTRISFFGVHEDLRKRTLRREEPHVREAAHHREGGKPHIEVPFLL